MMRPILSTLLAMVVAFPATAKNPEFVKTAPVADKPAVTRDPSLGYILLRTDLQLPLHLMRIPTPEDQVVYDGMRAAALEKERKKYPGRVSSYQNDLSTYETLKKSGNAGKKPQPPVEPTEANFVFTPFGLLAGASIGPMNRFAKGGKGKSVYLQSLTPGTYRIYGLVSVLPNGAFGTCYCMGSVKFTVRAGEITDLGAVRVGEGLIPSSAETDVDPRLKDWPIHPADYRAVGKLPNYFGLTLGRIQPIVGVIAYDRDGIIDLAADSNSAKPALP